MARALPVEDDTARTKGTVAAQASWTWHAKFAIRGPSRRSSSRIGGRRISSGMTGRTTRPSTRTRTNSPTTPGSPGDPREDAVAGRCVAVLTRDRGIITRQFLGGLRGPWVRRAAVRHLRHGRLGAITWGGRGPQSWWSPGPLNGPYAASAGRAPTRYAGDDNFAAAEGAAGDIKMAMTAERKTGLMGLRHPAG